MLHFTLLGGLGVAVDGVPVKIAIPRRGVALLSYVLLHGASRLNRERVATILWPDDAEADGRARLRRMLYLIGQGAPAANSPAWLVTDASTVMWNPAVARTLDVEQLRRAVSADALDPAPAYRGDLLPELEDEWVLPERERLRESLVAHLERVARTHLEAKNFAEARVAVLEVLRLEPWREDVMRTATGLRIATGDRAGALAELDRFRERLREELGVEAMPETLALRDSLVSAPAATTSAPSAPAIAPTVSEGIFVGREREFALLAEHFAETEAGRGSLVLIGGESGVGKSETIARFGRAAADRGACVVRAATTFVETRPYQPFAAALEDALPHVDRATLSPAGRSALERLLPGAAAELPEPHAERETALERNRLFEGVTSTFEALAARRPLVLVLEDVHWAGSDMMSLLEYVVRRAARTRILILASYRDGDLPRSHPLRALRRRLSEESLVAGIALGPLHVREVRRYLELRYGTVPAEAAERLFAASGGVPLVLAEFAERAPSLEDAIAAASPHPDAVAKLPALAARLEEIPAETQLLLEIAAVAGLGFDVELIVAVSGWSEAETSRHLGVALGRRIIRESTSGTYDFSHHLFREMVYDAIPPATRARRHALVAHALEELHADASDRLSSELAMHFERAGDSARAIEALRTAALRALTVFAHDDARTFSSRALALGASGDAAIDLLLVREEANRFSGDREARREDLFRCEALVDVRADPARAARILLRRFELDHQTANRDFGRDALERLETAAPHAGDAWVAWATLARGRFELRKNRRADASRALTAAARAFEACGDSRGIFETALALAAWERNAGQMHAIEEHFACAEAHLASLGDADDLVTALYEERANVASQRQRYAEAKSWAGRLLEAATKSRDVRRIANAHRLLGGAAARLLDVRPAYEHLAKSLELFEVLGEHVEAYSVIAFRGILESESGDLEAALASFLRARDIARTFEYDLGDAACASNAAHVQNRRGRFEEAAVLADAALGIAREIGHDRFRVAALINRGVALRELGRDPAAVETHREAAAASDGIDVRSLAAEAWAELALTLATADDGAGATAASNRANVLLSDLPSEDRPAIYQTLALAFARMRASPARAADHDRRSDVSRTHVP